MDDFECRRAPMRKRSAADIPMRDIFTGEARQMIEGARQTRRCCGNTRLLEFEWKETRKGQVAYRKRNYRYHRRA